MQVFTSFDLEVFEGLKICGKIVAKYIKVKDKNSLGKKNCSNKDFLI